jgi:hypothetical protein
MIRLGSLMFALGVLCTLVAIAPLATGGTPPSLLWFLAMLMGAGFLLIWLGFVRTARARSSVVRAATQDRR